MQRQYYVIMIAQKKLFADELNAFKVYDRDTPNDHIYADLKDVQQDLHH